MEDDNNIFDGDLNDCASPFFGRLKFNRTPAADVEDGGPTAAPRCFPEKHCSNSFKSQFLILIKECLIKHQRQNSGELSRGGKKEEIKLELY